MLLYLRGLGAAEIPFGVRRSVLSDHLSSRMILSAHFLPSHGTLESVLSSHDSIAWMIPSTQSERSESAVLAQMPDTLRRVRNIFFSSREPNPKSD